MKSLRRYFVFCHGFGFEARFWHPLLAFFPKEASFCLDLGYFRKDPILLLPNFPREETLLIGIGHSLGLIKLLGLEERFQALIGLNGFLNFLGKEATLRERRSRELHLLTESFRRAPSSALENFYKNCGITWHIPPSIQEQRALEDLTSLKESVVPPQGVPLLLIGAEDDPIVPPSLLEDNCAEYPAVLLERVPSGKHALGFLETASIYDKIKGFLDGILPPENSNAF